MDTTEENEESDESFEIISDTNGVHGEMEDFSAEVFSNSLVAVSINTEYSTKEIKEDNNDDEKNIIVKSEPSNESSVGHVLDQNLGKGSGTDTPVTHILDITNHQLPQHTQEGGVSTKQITNSDRKNVQGKHADSQPNQFTEVLSQEKTQDTDRNISQNNNQNNSAFYMKQSERMSIKFKINAAAESIASNLKDVNNKTDVDKHFIAEIDVEEDNKYTQNKDQKAHASNTMSMQIIDTDTGERNDHERTNSKLGKLNQKTFIEQEKHQSVTLDKKRDEPPDTLKLELSVDNECIDIESSREPRENNNVATDCHQEETLTKQNQDENKEDVSKENRHDNAIPISEQIANKAIENFQRSSDDTKINQSQIESLGQQEDYNDELEQHKTVERYQRESRDMEKNMSCVDYLDLKDRCKDMCDKEDSAASTKNQQTFKKSDQADVYSFHPGKRNDTNMTFDTVDVIVNTTGRELDLNNGAVSKSICNSAGFGMQKEIKKNYPHGIKYGDTAVTGSYCLECKMVLHCALFAWSGNAGEQKKSLQTLKMCITQCLLEANKRQHKTIAFPVLGTGNLNVPVKIAAKCMIDSIKEYEISQSKTSITNVKIIVYNDKQILKAAIQSFGNIKNAKVFITAEGLQIYVYQASILNLQVECIVNAANCKLDHGGGVAYAISRASGEIIEKESKGLIRKYGELEVVGPRWSDYKTKQESERQRCATDLERAIQSAVNKADQLRMSSIGIPPVSAGSKGSPTKAIAENLLKEILLLVHKVGTSCSINEIHVVNKNPDTTKTVVTLFDEHVSSEWKEAEEAQA
ncbi:hypothetical protein KUTeg_004796 [Tegillarca granosa]|uniref:Macro domain-containing protein n=1 Tax=Tegillarca granosa TaxID=220873 RepID=A0ABQ9FK11_TEGGR|nr:hypothetical protein KUTeg_004796 [Tegillarca granosa]